jgi:hypothetical protein
MHQKQPPAKVAFSSVVSADTLDCMSSTNNIANILFIIILIIATSKIIIAYYYFKTIYLSGE